MKIIIVTFHVLVALNFVYGPLVYFVRTCCVPLHIEQFHDKSVKSDIVY